MKVTVLWLWVFVGAMWLMSGCQSTDSSSRNPVGSEAERLQRAAALNVQLGIQYLAQGSTQRAKRKIQKALEFAPNWPPALDAQAYFFEQTGEFEEAEKLYKRAIVLSSASGSAQNNYGTFLCRQKRYDEAEKQFLLAARNTDYVNSAESYENAGLCSLDADALERAEQYFQKAILQDPKRSGALLELAELVYKKQNYGQAQKYYDRFVILDQQSARSLWLGIQLSEQLGTKNTAASYALLLRSKFSDTPEYQWYLQQHG